MYTVFLTGGIGSGKSTVAGMMARLGAQVVDTDALAGEVLREPGVMARLASIFGDDVLARGGEAGGRPSVDRALLAARAFATPEATAALDGATHPRIFARLQESLDALRRAGRHGVAVVEVPLIEAVGPDALAQTDEVVAVACPRALRRARAERRGMRGDDFDRRDARQATDEERAAVADTVIANDGGEEALRASVGAWWDARALEGWRAFRAGRDCAAAARAGTAGRLKSPAVAFVGRHNSGKTTLVEKVIAALVADGLDVGSVKHHGHAGFDIDVPGKDSWRHREAGANEVAVCSPDLLAVVRELEAPLEADAVIAMMRRHDIVVVEGFRHSGVPAVEVMRAANERDVAAARSFAAAVEQGRPFSLDPSLGPDADRVPDGLTAAVASDMPWALEAARAAGLEAFDIDDAAGVASWIEDRYVERRVESGRGRYHGGA